MAKVTFKTVGGYHIVKVDKITYIFNNIYKAFAFLSVVDTRRKGVSLC